MQAGCGFPLLFRGSNKIFRCDYVSRVTRYKGGLLSLELSIRRLSDATDTVRGVRLTPRGA